MRVFTPSRISTGIISPTYALFFVTNNSAKATAVGRAIAFHHPIGPSEVEEAETCSVEFRCAKRSSTDARACGRDFKRSGLLRHHRVVVNDAVGELEIAALRSTATGPWKGLRVRPLKSDRAETPSDAPIDFDLQLDRPANHRFGAGQNRGDSWLRRERGFSRETNQPRPR